MSRRRLAWPGVFVALAVGVSATTIALSRNATHPSRWDRRITDLVEFVERERGLRFKHPVYFELVPDEQFAERTLALESEPHEVARRKGMAIQLKAFGLVGRRVDVQGILRRFAGDWALGIYYSRTDRIMLRGTRLDADSRGVLVHELTHALQDQHFDLDQDLLFNRGRDVGFAAVVEGDARLVERAWEAEQAEDPAARLLRQEITANTIRDRLSGVPEVVLDLASVPYVLGPEIVRAANARRPRDGRDHLFRYPPWTEEQVLAPDRYSPQRRSVRVAPPDLDDGDRPVRGADADLGVLTLFMVLGDRLEVEEARAAVDGWDGSAAAPFVRDGNPCVRATLRFDDAADAGRFATAFTKWAVGMPAKHSVAGRTVDLESCAPTRPRPVVPALLSPFQTLTLPIFLRDLLVQLRAPAETASCAAPKLASYVVDRSRDDARQFRAFRLQVADEFLRCGSPLARSVRGHLRAAGL